jgi:hypothetical protein
MAVNSNQAAGCDAQALAREFRYLAHLIFRVEPLPELVEAYLKANTIVFRGADVDRFQRLITAAVDKRGDLEAVEVVLRMKNKSNFLTQKMQILFYLMETRPEYFSLFVNQKQRRFKAYILLGLQTLRSSYKLIKGYLMLRSRSYREFLRSEARS